jgi:hypothetical protein
MQDFKRNKFSINYGTFNFYISILYVILAHCLSPLYKFMEVYHDFPHINLSVVRAFFLGLVLLISTSIFLVKYLKVSFFKNALALLILPFISILWVTFVILFSYPFIEGSYENVSELFLVRVDAVIVGYWMMFFAGFHIDKGYKWDYIFISWLVFVLVLIFNIDFLFASFISFEQSNTISYIFLSDAFAFLSIILIFETKSKPIALIVWVVTFFILFLIPSRTTLACFLIGTFIPLLFKPYIFKWIIIVSLGSGLFFMTYNFKDNLFFESNRIINTDLDSDSSLQARSDIKETNFENLKKTWFFGDFMGDIRLSKGEDGFYTHSYISLWEQFGLIPFILFFFSVLFLLYHLLRLFSLFRYDGVINSSLALMIFTLIAISFSRSFFNGYIWFLFSRVFVFVSSPHFRTTRI